MGRLGNNGVASLLFVIDALSAFRALLRKYRVFPNVIGERSQVGGAYVHVYLKNSKEGWFIAINKYSGPLNAVEKKDSSF